MTSPTRMSAVMDQLVAGARASRDGVFNTLDAVERKSLAANASLVQQVAKICVEHTKRQPAEAAAGPGPVIANERDTRFDPEDEWDVAGPRAAVTRAAGASDTPVGNLAAAGDDEADSDGFPETWLR